VSALGPSNASGPPEAFSSDSGSLADVLERVLDKGVVIAGDIQINLLDIELLTIKLRLVIASVDTARSMGINWWESDPMLAGGKDNAGRSISERVGRIERQLGSGTADDDELDTPRRRAPRNSKRAR
jgi:Gas vesicle protein